MSNEKLEKLKHDKYVAEKKLTAALTDNDVMDLLTFIFQSEAVQKKLNMLIESRKESATTGSDYPLSVR